MRQLLLGFVLGLTTATAAQPTPGGYPCAIMPPLPCAGNGTGCECLDKKGGG